MTSELHPLCAVSITRDIELSSAAAAAAEGCFDLKKISLKKNEIVYYYFLLKQTLWR
jgi:hypothetical protein